MLSCMTAQTGQPLDGVAKGQQRWSCSDTERGLQQVCYDLEELSGWLCLLCWVT